MIILPSASSGITSNSLFKPTNISNLGLWLDATKGLFDATSGGNPVTTDGATVARWEDQSGNGYHVTQATSDNRPILKTSVKNSKNILRFDGSDDLLISANISENNLSAMTCFVVAYVAGFGGGNFGRYFERGSGALGLVIGWFVNSNDGNTNRLSAIGGNFFHDTAINSIAAGNWYLNSAKWNGGTNRETDMSQKVNRVSSTRGLTGTGATTSVSNTTYQIGNRATVDRAFNGDIAELIIYNQALSTEQIDNVEGYLAAKWGF